LPIDLPVVERPEAFSIGLAGEQLGIPPDVAGFDGFAFGVGQARQRVLRQAKIGLVRKSRRNDDCDIGLPLGLTAAATAPPFR